MDIITVKDLSKSFRAPINHEGRWGALKSLFNPKQQIKKALDDISFEIKKGELVGYIGPNGAGKSTTVKILSGILLPDAGDVKVFGKNPSENRVETVKRLGVVFGQKSQLWWDLPVIESFELLKEIYAVPTKEYLQAFEELAETLSLKLLLQIPVRQLSLGQRMRCELAASLLHHPEILFLDEPTIGLDAVSKLAVRDFIRKLNREKGVTILLTTHDMDDIESLCERVLLLNEGKIFLDGTLQEMRRKILPERRLIIDLENEHDTVQDPEAFLIKQEGHRIFLSFNPETTTAPSLIHRILERHAIRDLYVENPPIEEIIAQFYRKVNL